MLKPELDLRDRRGTWAFGRVRSVAVPQFAGNQCDRRWLGSLPTVDGSRLGETKIKDSDLSNIKQLPTLRYLSLENTRVTDTGLESLTGSFDSSR